jgi:hypothetical protein
MLSLSASHAETEVHVVRSATAVHAATTEAQEVHVVTTEVQEVHVVSVRLRHQSRTTSQRCSNKLQ